MNSSVKNLITFVVFVILVGLGYYLYRQQVNPSAADLVNVRKLSSLPASICQISKADFTGASVAVVHVAKGKMRTDAKVIGKGGEPKVIHIIYSDENNGTLHTWFEGDEYGAVSTNTYAQGGFSVPEGAAACSPWWLPDTSVFTVPLNVIFVSA